MIGRIFIDDLEIFAKHGVYDAERAKDQRFLISISAEYDAKDAMLSDNISDAVNYADIIETTMKSSKSCQFSLIERLAKHIADEIFKKFSEIISLSITIKKFPNDLSSYKFMSIGFSSTFER
jgi:dihydroneopterin aldolase